MLVRFHRLTVDFLTLRPTWLSRSLYGRSPHSKSGLFGHTVSPASTSTTIAIRPSLTLEAAS